MKNIKPELQVIAKFLYTELINELTKRDHVASQKLLRSTEVLVMDIVGGFDIRGQYLYYGRFVETGRKANANLVPIKALIEWIRYKKLRLNPWAVQKSIQKKGIRPSKWQSDPLDANIDKVAKKIEDAAEKQLYLLIENMIQNTLILIQNGDNN